MKRKGINYDVGTFFTQGRSSRPIFDRGIVRREIEIIKNDLHCNAIRISGQEIERLVFAAEVASEQGLEVWFSPCFIDANETKLLSYLTTCAQAAEQIRQQYPSVVFVVGCELTLFMPGILDGATSRERISSLSTPTFWMKNALPGNDFNKKLNRVLATITTTVREHFHGELSYSSGTWEKVDWSPFDIVSVDHYRDARNQNSFTDELRRYFTHSKPVVITEFGCCAYRGAELKGGMGWAIVDATKTPPQLNGEYIRDEAVQSRYITDLLTIFQSADVDGAFVFTFVSPIYSHSELPLYDLDMASYSIVTSFLNQHGTTYPDLPWEPKAAFHTLANYYLISPSAP